MANYIPIACGLYDHIELACLYRYEVRMTVIDGDDIVGTATGTETDAARQEWLILDDGDRRVRLDRICSLETLTEGARFGKVEFRRS